MNSTPLDAEKILAQIQGNRLITEIQVLQETSSTNDVAAKLARESPRSGIAIFAEHQLAGRGRLGRRWESAAHRGLWFSLLLRPHLPPAQTARITTWAAVSVAQALDPFAGLPIGIKWPNDLYIGPCKICGILCETSASDGRAAAIIVGIGLNVNHLPEDFPPELRSAAGSLSQAAGRSLDREAVAAAILNALAASFQHLDSGFEILVREARRRSILLGKHVVLTAGTAVHSGIAMELEADGSLLLRLDGGGVQPVHAGEVTKVAW